MNKLEAAYSEHLDQQYAAGLILWRSQHEPLSLKLADNTFYRPDFMVLAADSVLEIHDTKGGFFPDKNKAKWKIAAQMFPFRFVIVRRVPQERGYKGPIVWGYDAV